jgi:hypothetical protein
MSTEGKIRGFLSTRPFGQKHQAFLRVDHQTIQIGPICDDEARANFYIEQFSKAMARAIDRDFTT